MLLLLLLQLLHLVYCDKKMVIVWGTPEIAFTPTTATPSTLPWDECVDSCWNDDTCFAVHGDPDKLCTMYLSGDLVTVKDEKGASTGNRVAFKIPEAPTTCTDSVTGNTYEYSPLPNSIISDAAFNVESTTGLYSVTYDMYPDRPFCKDWYEGTPECKQECYTMMLTFRAASGSFSNNYKDYELPLTRDCLVKCFLQEDCFLATSSAGYCTLYPYGGDVEMKRNGDEHRMVGVKLTFGADNCALTLEQAITDYTYNLPSSSGFTKVKLVMGSDNIVRVQYIKDTFTCADADVQKPGTKAGCFQQIKKSLNYAEARAECIAMGGADLMAVYGVEELNNPYHFWYMTMAFRTAKVHVGLTRADASSEWKWSVEGLGDASTMVWADGQPGEGNCAWMVLQKTNDVERYLYAHDCNDIGDGYICYKGNTF